MQIYSLHANVLFFRQHFSSTTAVAFFAFPTEERKRRKRCSQVAEHFSFANDIKTNFESKRILWKMCRACFQCPFFIAWKSGAFWDLNGVKEEMTFSGNLSFSLSMKKTCNEPQTFLRFKFNDLLVLLINPNLHILSPFSLKI